MCETFTFAVLSLLVKFVCNVQFLGFQTAERFNHIVFRSKNLFIKNASHQTEWGENVFAVAALHWGIHDLKKLERNPEKRTQVFDWKIHLQGSKSHRRTPEEGHESKTETSIFKETSNASLHQCRLL